LAILQGSVTTHSHYLRDILLATGQYLAITLVSMLGIYHRNRVTVERLLLGIKSSPAPYLESGGRTLRRKHACHGKVDTFKVRLPQRRPRPIGAHFRQRRFRDVRDESGLTPTPDVLRRRSEPTLRATSSLMHRSIASIR